MFDKFRNQRSEIEQRMKEEGGSLSPTPQGGQGDATQYAPIVDKVSKKYGVPSELTHAVIKAESNYNPKAVSPKGAQGLMQIMPETGKQLRLQDPFNPEQNIDAGTRYLAGLLKRYNGNQTLALIAYNGGRLPKETLDYVRKVLKPGEAQMKGNKIHIAGQTYEVD